MAEKSVSIKVKDDNFLIEKADHELIIYYEQYVDVVPLTKFHKTNVSFIDYVEKLQWRLIFCDNKIFGYFSLKEPKL